MKKFRGEVSLPLISLGLSLCFAFAALAEEEKGQHYHVASESDTEAPGEEGSDTGTPGETGSDTQTPSEKKTEIYEDDEPVPIDDYDGSYGFYIQKLGDHEILKDAVFRLYLSFEDAAADEDPLLFTYNETKEYYLIIPGSMDGAVTRQTTDIYAGETYIDVFEPGYYYLVETAAPAGYRRYPGIFEIYVTEEGDVYWREENSGEPLDEATSGILTIMNLADESGPGTGEGSGEQEDPGPVEPDTENPGPGQATPSDAMPEQATPSDSSGEAAPDDFPPSGRSSRRSGGGSSGGSAVGGPWSCQCF